MGCTGVDVDVEGMDGRPGAPDTGTKQEGMFTVACQSRNHYNLVLPRATGPGAGSVPDVVVAGALG